LYVCVCRFDFLRTLFLKWHPFQCRNKNPFSQILSHSHSLTHTFEEKEKRITLYHSRIHSLLYHSRIHSLLFPVRQLQCLCVWSNTLRVSGRVPQTHLFAYTQHIRRTFSHTSRNTSSTSVHLQPPPILDRLRASVRPKTVTRSHSFRLTFTLTVGLNRPVGHSE